jgi:putative tryptophan/tyrosine transport system substrate-binding protein
MKRRETLGLMGGAAAASAVRPSALWAQQKALPVIAYVSGRSLVTDSHLLAAFREGLKEMGFVDGQNVTMDVRWADGQYDRIPGLMAETVKARPNLLVALGGNQLGLAAKAATSTIPVVFGTGADPVSLGLVSSLGRPDGNLTGMTLLATALDAKRLELLREMAPGARSIAILFNPSNPGAGDQRKEAQAAANTLGFNLRILEARTEAEIDQAFESLDSAPVDGLAVTVDSFLISQRVRIVAAMAARKLPAMFPAREFTDGGGLASYAPRWSDMYGVLGVYAGRILKGAKPGDLPVQRPTTFELVVNLRTAKALGLSLSPGFLDRADEVIE